MAEISWKDKLKCLQRELALRKAAYPKFVASGRMKQETAEREIDIMAAIVKDYSDAVDE